MSPERFPRKKNLRLAVNFGFAPLFTGQLFIRRPGLRFGDSRKATDEAGLACPRARGGRRPDGAKCRRFHASVVLQKFSARFAASPPRELLNHKPHWNHKSSSVPLNPKFAKEIAPTGGELRIWDTSCRFHDRIKTDHACADGARRLAVPRHHLGGLGF